MIEMIKELKAVMKKKDLSAEEASHYIHCSAKSVFRWLRNEFPPRPSSRRLIQEGIRKIKEAFPETKQTGSTWNLMQKAKALWPKIRQQLTLEERAELLDIQNSKPLEAYIERLEELVEKYEK